MATPARREGDSDGLVKKWLKAYEVEKERAFIRRIDSFIPQSKVKLLDAGCGIGLHAALWAERGKAVTASDLSPEFREHILRTYTFPFVLDDVLNSGINEQFDICFCMAIGTILHEEAPRFRTFDALAGFVRAGGFLVLISISNQRLTGLMRKHEPMHGIEQADLRRLQALGFTIEALFCWSCTPKFLWPVAVLRTVGKLGEIAGSRLGIGARKVVICRKTTSGTSLSEAAG